MQDNENSEIREEKELERLVLDEFERMEKDIKKPVEPDKAGDEGSQKSQGAESSLEDEERFITQVVDWLKPRKKRYDILNKIWSRMADMENNSGMTPEEEKMLAQDSKPDIQKNTEREITETEKKN